MRSFRVVVDAIFLWLTRLQLRQPWLVMAVVLASAAGAGLLASRLELRTSLGELLPENKESVIIADRVNARLSAMSVLAIVAEGQDNEGLMRFVDALAPELRKIDPALVGSVDEGVQQTQAFFEKHKLLYAPLDLVEEVHQEILDRYEYEVGKQAGFLLDEDEPPPPLTEESIRQRLEERARAAGIGKEAQQRFPHGYYLDLDKHHIAVRVLTPIGAADIPNTERLVAEVEAAIARVEPTRFDPSIRVGLAGNLLSAAETYNQIKGDLTHVGAWGVGLVLGVVLLFYLRLRTVLAMTLSVGVGAAWTFGLAYLLIGHLNSSTGFLFSIVVGNGINFAIIYMARYLEARRTEAVEPSIRTATLETRRATVTAAAAACAAYGSLVVTDFRGFKHFGIIGGSGMLLCWLSTYLMLPAILVVSERILPLPQNEGWVAKLGVLYGRPFAYLVDRAPRALLVFAALVTVASGALGYRYLRADPMEYDMHNIGNKPVERESEVTRLNRIANAVVGRLGQDGLAIAVDRLEQVEPLAAALNARREAAKNKPFERVVTIHSLLPDAQAKKIELIEEARRTLQNAYDKGFIAQADWDKLTELLPRNRLEPIGIAELPDQVARPFTEKDGSRGKLVYIVPSEGRSVWDGRYLIEWAESFRSTELPDGSVVKGSGQSVIFADMILAIGEDAPRAIVASLVLTLLIVLLAFRAKGASAWVIGSVLIGLVWTLGTLAVARSHFGESGFELEPMRLNFLNFVALPITIGVGADYAVNIMHRRQLDRDIRRVVVETGGAVILCSLTTILGYLALTLSINEAIWSFGVAAAAGEVCCVLVGVLVLPAALSRLAQERERPAAEEASLREA